MMREMSRLNRSGMPPSGQGVVLLARRTSWRRCFVGRLTTTAPWRQIRTKAHARAPKPYATPRDTYEQAWGYASGARDTHQSTYTQPCINVIDQRGDGGAERPTRPARHRPQSLPCLATVIWIQRPYPARVAENSFHRPVCDSRCFFDAWKPSASFDGGSEVPLDGSSVGAVEKT